MSKNEMKKDEDFEEGAKHYNSTKWEMNLDCNLEVAKYDK